ncbi:MAG TPA: aldehyde dehydrogenase family protein [Gaiellaceae bacterium]|nr:aldehyde dehydrogenase family protein [Gaiellaceae bacterium]
MTETIVQETQSQHGRLPAWIAGPVETGRWITVCNPFNGSVIAEVSECGAEDVDNACAVAAAALHRDDFPQHARARVLETAAEKLRGRTDDFARTIALESGKPIRTARLEALRCVDTLTFAAVEARRLSGELVPMEASQAGAGKLGFVLRVPIGVVAAISPFNFPLNLVAHKVAPAIAAGCPVVLKPASATPLSALKLVALLCESGLPEDWVSVVPGPGGEVGDALVANDVPALVTFTGSPAVGWTIPARAPKKRVSLELGSNAPLIIEPDADLQLVAEKAAAAGFSHAGQSCISTQRILIHERIYNKFLGHLVEAVERLVVGDPLEEATDVGPLISQPETARVLAWIEEAVSRGGRVLAGGRLENGLLIPTIIDGVPRDASVCVREVFGPVVVTIRYEEFDEALAIANESDFGLHAGVFTNDLGKAMNAARSLRFGGVLINDVPTFRADQQPYGGVRESGNTREGPAYAVREMTELRFVALPA